MASGLWSRMTGKTVNTLDGDLKNVTESGVIDVPKELLATIVTASSDSDNRREIMRHLHNCLAESSSKKWRRIHAGLLLVEDLTRKGNPLLLVETAEGQHFDLVQRLSFLEKFELSTDVRVQSKIRNMANNLRTELVPRLQNIEAEACTDEARMDTVSNCSGTSAATCSTASTSTAAPAASLTGFGSEDAVPTYSQNKSQGRMVLNGIVKVGHSEDTDSESSSDEKEAPARHRRGQHKKTHRPRGNDSSDSDGSADKKNSSCARVAAPPPPQVETVDLLAF